MTPPAGRRGREVDRPGLRHALRQAYPWVEEPEMGPRAVDAGDCDRCGRAPRLLPTCGPVPWMALCRGCAHDVADEGWCEGHAEDGARMRVWAAQLPPEWATVVLLWWVATGEVELDRLVLPPTDLPPGVRDPLPGPHE